MTPEEYVQQSAQRMSADGSVVSSLALPGGTAVVGYQSKFRLRWMATKLHLFTIVISVPRVTPEIFDGFMTQTIDYAKNANGGLRGFQTGVGVIPIVVAAAVDPDARAVVERRPPRVFSVIVMPAIVDLQSAQTYRYSGRLVVGAFYTAWLRQRLNAAAPA